MAGGGCTLVVYPGYPRYPGYTTMVHHHRPLPLMYEHSLMSTRGTAWCSQSATRVAGYVTGGRRLPPLPEGEGRSSLPNTYARRYSLLRRAQRARRPRSPREHPRTVKRDPVGNGPQAALGLPQGRMAALRTLGTRSAARRQRARYRARLLHVPRSPRAACAARDAGTRNQARPRPRAADTTYARGIRHVARDARAHERACIPHNVARAREQLPLERASNTFTRSRGTRRRMA